MLEAEHLAGAPKARLHLVHGEDDIVLAAERLQLLRVFHREEVRAAPLIAFRHHAGDLVRLDPLVAQSLQEEIEGGVLVLEAIREGYLDEGGVAIHHPALLLLPAAGKLRAHGAPVEGVLEGDEVLLLRAVLLKSVRLAQLDAVLRCLTARAEDEDGVIVRPGRERLQHRGELCAPLVHEDVGGEQALVNHLTQRLLDLFGAMARVGDEYARRPVDPAVAPRIRNDEVLRLVPDDRGLAHHRLRLRLLQLLKDRERLGHGQLRFDRAVLRIDMRNLDRLQTIDSHVLPPWVRKHGEMEEWGRETARCAGRPGN